MDTQKKLLIVFVIIVIGVAGVLIGYFIGLNMQPKLNISPTNNTTVLNNTTVNNNSSTPASINKTHYIGEAAAKQKAIEFLTEYGIIDKAEIRSIDFVTINGVPLYRIKYWDHYIMADGHERGWDEVLIGAKDGRLYDDYGYLVKT